MTSESQENNQLGVLFIATGGQNGSLLGSDEEEIVLFLLAILDLEKNEVTKTKHYTVQPRTSDINENLLSEECKVDFKLTDEIVKNSKALETVIEEVDDFIREEGLAKPDFTFIVEGQLPLRQTLHPEASAKDLNLPEYYNRFFDLKKEFTLHYNEAFEDVSEIFQHFKLCPVGDCMTTKLDQMVAIVQHMLRDGHVFANPELIQVKLEPGICSRGEEVDGNCVVRARGLPWQSSDQDIAKFFKGLNIAKGGVALCLSPQGRRNGEALIRFETEEHREMALKRHKHHIGTRYIEVYKASGEDFISVAGGNNNEAQAFLTKGAQVIVRMRGLPYDCTAKQVLEFFDGGENPCDVLDGEEGVLFVRRPDGRATGDAFVLFRQEEDSVKALSKHRESIGSRYIELFRSTTAEVQQVLNRCLEQIKPEAQLPLVSPVSPATPQVPPAVLQQHMITAGTRKDCIRLRGLPYEAQVEHILEFLGEHAKNIVYQGVHMVYNSQGQPSGEAFIQMDSEQSAYIAAQSKHHRYMVYFKKQRYIEVFQCSGEDMSCVLTGGLPSPQKFVSPGMSPPGQQSPGPISFPFAPLSPTESYNPLLRQNPMAAAIAAAAAASLRQGSPFPPRGQPFPGLFNPLSPISMGGGGMIPVFGHSLLGSPPAGGGGGVGGNLNFPGLMGSPPSHLSPNSPMPANFMQGGSGGEELAAFQRLAAAQNLFPPQLLIPMSSQAMLLNNLISQAEMKVKAGNKRRYPEEYSNYETSPAKRGIWYPSVAGGASGGSLLTPAPPQGAAAQTQYPTPSPYYPGKDQE